MSLVWIVYVGPDTAEAPDLESARLAARTLADDLRERGLWTDITRPHIVGLAPTDKEHA